MKLVKFKGNENLTPFDDDEEKHMKDLLKK